MDLKKKFRKSKHELTRDEESIGESQSARREVVIQQGAKGEKKASCGNPHSMPKQNADLSHPSSHPFLEILS